MKKSKKVDAISTFLGPDAAIEGTIEFQGTIRLDGKVKGKIQSNGGTVIVGEKAVIHADVMVDVAIIYGEVNGTVSARDRIAAYPPCRVVGDIQAPIISIEAGVVFNGNCAMSARTIASQKGTPSSNKEPAQKQLKPK